MVIGCCTSAKATLAPWNLIASPGLEVLLRVEHRDGLLFSDESSTRQLRRGYVTSVNWCCTDHADPGSRFTAEGLGACYYAGETVTGQ